MTRHFFTWRLWGRMVSRLTVVAFLIALAPPLATSAQDESEAGWRQLSVDASGPGPRWDHTLAADDAEKQLIVFGGRDGGGASLGDTWLYDRSEGTWTEVTTGGPEPRFGHAVAVDQEARRLYLFGGQSADQFFNDVWQFDLDGDTWSRIDTGDSPLPAPRYGTSAVLDGAGRLLVSHGFTFEGRFDDTWSLDLETNTWTDVSPADGGTRPLKRCLHEAIWDPAAGRMLLFGGCSSGFGPCPQGDLWSFDPETRSWSEITPDTGPSPRSNPALVLDSRGDRALLVAGLSDAGYTADVWIGTATDDDFGWNELVVAGPAPDPRASHDAVMTGGVVYLFGGTGNGATFNDLWRLKLPAS